jgi:hypothetical protein
MSLGVSPPDQAGPRLAAAVQPVVSAQQAVCRLANRRRLLSSPGRTAAGDGADRASEVLTQATVSVFDALFEITGAHTVVDSSKRPQEAAVLATSGRFDHYVVHLVRDPRAVVHSWNRAKPLPTATGAEAMPSRRVSKTLMRWLENCSGAEYLRPHIERRRWVGLRYEDFAARPRATIRLIGEMLGESVDAPFISDDTVLLSPNHYLSGNPSRFRTGAVRISPDSEWRRALPRRQRTIVASATLPFLLRYGYPVTDTSVRSAS